MTENYTKKRGLRRHLNACIISKTRLTFAEHVSQSGICSMCTQDGVCEIGLRAKTGRVIYPEPFGAAQFGSEKVIPNLEDIQILPEIWGKGVWFDKVKTECKIGGFKCTVPIAIAALGSTKVASGSGDSLSKGAAKAGIPRVLGENVLMTFGESMIKKIIDNYKKNSNGKGAIIIQVNANEHKMNLAEKAVRLGADGIEIKLGQGAKQGLGGEILFEGAENAKKYEKLGCHIIPRDKNIYERHCYPGDIIKKNLEELLIEYSKFEKPIWAKIGYGSGIIELIDFLDKLKRDRKIPFECLTIDGFGGGTGMSPWDMMNECSLPSAAVFSKLKKKTNFDILLAGGYLNAADMTKGLMLGANGIAIGRAALIATKAHENGIENYISSIKKELQMFCATLKTDDIIKIIGKRKKLYALSAEAGKLFGI